MTVDGGGGDQELGIQEPELSTEILQKNAHMLREAMNSIIIGTETTKGWREYREGREIGEGREFNRPPGSGEGAWIVKNYGPYTIYDHQNGDVETKIVLQRGGTFPFDKSVILISEIEGRDPNTAKAVKKQEHRNTPTAVRRVEEFIKGINGGEMPVSLMDTPSATSNRP